MTLITKSEELMAVSVRQGVELAAIEAKVLLGYLEGHDYSLMMDDKFHLALHDNQDGENAKQHLKAGELNRSQGNQRTKYYAQIGRHDEITHALTFALFYQRFILSRDNLADSPRKARR